MLSLLRSQLPMHKMRTDQQNDEDADEEGGDHVVLTRRVWVHLGELLLEHENRHNLRSDTTRALISRCVCVSPAEL